jgi:2-haloacid dehalogenase
MGKSMRRYDGVLFDLLTGLLDSWTLWNDVAGSDEHGLAWRREYLRVTYGTNEYHPYEDLVEEAALATGLRPGMAAALAARYFELRPWPGVREALSALRRGGLRLGVVTNCSRRLAHLMHGHSRDSLAGVV